MNKTDCCHVQGDMMDKNNEEIVVSLMCTNWRRRECYKNGIEKLFE